MLSTTNSDATGGLAREIELLIELLKLEHVMIRDILSMLVIVTFEYLITFDREVNYAWGRKMTWARAIFFINRYVIILQSFLLFANMFLPKSGFPRQPLIFGILRCVHLPRIAEVLAFVLYGAEAAFSGLRVSVFSGHQKFIPFLVSMLSLLRAVAYLVRSALTTFMVEPHGCVSHVNMSHDVSLGLTVLADVALLFAEAFVVVVTVIGTRVRYCKHRQGSFQYLLLREGVLYFVAILVASAVQMCSNSQIDDIQDLVGLSLASAHTNIAVPILISRFYLNLDELRELREREVDNFVESPRKWKPLPPLPSPRTGMVA